MRTHHLSFHRFVVAMRISAVAMVLASPTWAQSERTHREASPTTTVTKPVPALLPLAEQFDIMSANTGRTYRIYVSKPIAPAPASGYAVLYVLDADTAFPTAASQAILSSLSGDHKPVLVVGVGYPDTMATISLRTRDMTPFLPIPETDVKMSVKPEDWGGAEAFHKFMLEELRPIIDGMAAVDKSDQSLMGYSLGGLFALHVLLSNPVAYKNYVIGSPAIFYTGKKVLEGVPPFAKVVQSGKVSPRILITVGEWEQSAGPRSLPESYRMVDNARELAETLRKIEGQNGYSVDFTMFANEMHNSGIPAATSRGVAFVGHAGEAAAR